MTNHETHPAGTADLVKRLRSYQEFEQNRDGQIVCVESEIANEAADRIEQLVATVEQIEAAITRANAATAAAYEVSAQLVDKGHKSHIIAKGRNPDDYVSPYSIISRAIRALATPDQTAALDKMITEAVKPYVEALRYYETQFCEGFCEDMPDRSVTNESMENDCSGCKARAILAASKKGGV